MYGSTGSGIFQGRTSQNHYYITGYDVSTLLISRVSKNLEEIEPSQQQLFIKQYYLNGTTSVLDQNPMIPEGSDSLLMVPYTLENFKMLKLNMDTTKVAEKLTQNGLVCDIKVKYSVDEGVLRKDNHYYYFLTIRNGLRSFSGQAEGSIQACGIVACPEDDIRSCGKK